MCWTAVETMTYNLYKYQRRGLTASSLLDVVGLDFFDCTLLRDIDSPG